MLGCYDVEPDLVMVVADRVPSQSLARSGYIFSERFDEWCLSKLRGPIHRAYWSRELPNMRKDKP